MHSLVEDGVAQRDNRLKVGDKLVSVNGTSVVNHSLQVSLHHSEVVHLPLPPSSSSSSSSSTFCSFLIPLCLPHLSSPFSPPKHFFAFLPSSFFPSFVSRPHPLVRRNGLVNTFLPFSLHSSFPPPSSPSLPSSCPSCFSSFFQFAVQQLLIVPLGGMARLGVNHPVPASPEINSSPGSPLVFFMDTQIMVEGSAHNTLPNVRTCSVIVSSPDPTLSRGETIR